MIALSVAIAITFCSNSQLVSAARSLGGEVSDAPNSKELSNSWLENQRWKRIGLKGVWRHLEYDWGVYTFQEDGDFGDYELSRQAADGRLLQRWRLKRIYVFGEACGDTDTCFVARLVQYGMDDLPEFASATDVWCRYRSVAAHARFGCMDFGPPEAPIRMLCKDDVDEAGIV
mmetsp:Transcript_20617/g.58457  ORF Transcript_20617/g.58457 Transcript_20617/m.58457 type:complete len:173 (-) Transcript_20617:151-669(-)